MSETELTYEAPFPPGEAGELRELLTSLYVAVLGHLYDVPDLFPHGEAIERLQTTVLDAAEGRAFAQLPSPWPPIKNEGGTAAATSSASAPAPSAPPSPAPPVLGGASTFSPEPSR